LKSPESNPTTPSEIVIVYKTTKKIKWYYEYPIELELKRAIRKEYDNYAKKTHGVIHKYVDNFSIAFAQYNY